MKDAFGDRMKEYESQNSIALDGNLPVCIRLDGRAFSKFTKQFDRPFDSAFNDTMAYTTKALVKETGARIGYTQSDEISLIITKGEKPGSEIMFGGKIQKLVSTLASFASVHFYKELSKHKDLGDKAPTFDGRAWNVPSEIEAANVLLWRSHDARRNAVSSLYRHTFGHQKMMNKSSDQMVKELGSLYDNLEPRFKYGTFFKSVTRKERMSDEMWNDIPLDKRPAKRTVTRSYIEDANILYFGHMDTTARVREIFGCAALEEQFQ